MMVLGVSGSRNLSPAGCAQVGTAVSAVLAGGGQVLVGCATGADATAVRSALAVGEPSRLSILAAFGPDGSGNAGAVSAVDLIRHAASIGVPVLWWGGLNASVPLRVRLVRRSLRLVTELRAAGGSLALFVDGPPPRSFGSGAFPACGSGSWSTAAAAAKEGVPVIVFGCLPEALPLLPAAPTGGTWQPVDTGPLVNGWRWAPAPGLFG